MTAVLPFRQVHLDFHTSEHIPGVGADFDGPAFAAALVAANVESVVLFAKCHHGWSYYDTAVGARHPNLGFDLLRAQYDACRAAGIKVPVYLSVGWDERAARAHVDWRQVSTDGTFFCLLGRHIDAAWKYMCLGTPYLDAITAQIDEILTLFPDADGLWLDIIKQEQCLCVHCQAGMTAAGLDWTVEPDRLVYRRRVLDTYLDRSVAAARARVPGIAVFHNTSMVPRGDRRFFEAFSHIEVESLPTGGWGYDHLPMAAKYAGTLGLDRLGVTARFHIVWGELGGYKHPNALRYEACAMLTHGVKVCVGDHLDPRGVLDASAYRMIGNVFAEVATKAQWCDGGVNVADVALLSSVAVRSPGSINRVDRHCPEDEGALRILNEGHVLFDVIDAHADFAGYRVLVLPDRVRLDAALAAKLTAYVAGGGRLLLTAESGLDSDATKFALPVAADLHGPSPFNPTFVLAETGIRPDWIDAPFIVLAPSLRAVAHAGASLGDVHEPYFNRTPHHFNGHINAPARVEPSGYTAGVIAGGVAWLAQPVFSLYRELGSVAVKAYVLNVLGRLLPDPVLRAGGLPAAATVTLRRLPDGRHIVHLLYATPALRGQTVLGPLEVVEDLPLLGPVEIELRLPMPATAARLVPEGTPLDLVTDGAVQRLRVERFACHQMIELS